MQETKIVLFGEAGVGKSRFSGRERRGCAHEAGDVASVALRYCTGVFVQKV
jgi:hypothetical protein